MKYRLFLVRSKIFCPVTQVTATGGNTAARLRSMGIETGGNDVSIARSMLSTNAVICRHKT